MRTSSKVLVSSIFGFLIAGFLIEQAHQLRISLNRKISLHASRWLRCKATVDLDYSALLFGVFKIRHLWCEDAAKFSWSWHVKDLVCAIDWIESIKTLKVCLLVDVSSFQVISHYKNHELSIQEHINFLLEPTYFFLPFHVNRLKLNQGNVALFHKYGVFKSKVTLATAGMVGESSVRLYDGTLSLQGTDLIKNINILTYLTCDGKWHGIVHGDFRLHDILPLHLNLRGEWRGDKGTFFLGTKNEDYTLKVEGSPSEFCLSGICAHSPSIKYKIQRKLDKWESKFVIGLLEGQAIASRNDAHLSLLNQHGAFDIKIANQPNDKTNALAIVYENGKQIVSGKWEHDNRLMISVQNAWLNKYVKKYCSATMSQNSQTNITLYPKTSGITFKIFSEELFLRLQPYYNFIDTVTIQGEIDPFSQKITFCNSLLQFQQGKVTLSNGTFFIKDGTPFCSFPFVIDDLFISHKKDFFAIISGAPYLSTSDKKLKLSGYILLEECQLQEEFLSRSTDDQEIKESLPFPLHLDVQVFAREPLKIKTSLFELGLCPKLLLAGTFERPLIKGFIDSREGMFFFPYKPLHVRSGKIVFSEDDFAKVHIDITAKNTIKKHTITMNVSGDISNYALTFSSSPALTYEQIITLLFGGSLDGALHLSLPKTLNDFLERQSKFNNSYVGPLLHSLSTIRIAPSLSDQKGSGGTRGSVMVEVADHLRAVVQQNFNVNEAAYWELEYDLSEDSSIKAIKDEHGDMSAQFEMRWKF